MTSIQKCLHKQQRQKLKYSHVIESHRSNQLKIESKHKTMIMIQPQVYPHFNSPGALVKREGSTASPTSVIKETESVRNLSIREPERQRSLSPTMERTSIIRRRSISPATATTKVITLTGPAATAAAVAAAAAINKFDVQRFIKRSNSADYEDYQFEDQIIKHSEDECHDRQYDSEPEGRDHDRYEYSSGNRYATDEEDLPLDLSLSSERRRTRTYSDTESDDSAGTGEDKVTGKAAYKKSLMKRYCKYKQKCKRITVPTW